MYCSSFEQEAVEETLLLIEEYVEQLLGTTWHLTGAEKILQFNIVSNIRDLLFCMDRNAGLCRRWMK